MKFKDLSYLFRFVKAHGPALLLALLLLAADVSIPCPTGS